MQKGIWFFKGEIQKNVPPVKFTKCELVQFCVKVTVCFLRQLQEPRAPKAAPGAVLGSQGAVYGAIFLD